MIKGNTQRLILLINNLNYSFLIMINDCGYNLTDTPTLKHAYKQEEVSK